MSIFEAAAASALPAWQSVFANVITYTRGSESVTISAIEVDEQVVTEAADGVYETVIEKQFHIKITDLVLNSVQATPEENDEITSNDNKVYRYSTNYEELIDTQEYIVPVKDFRTE